MYFFTLRILNAELFTCAIDPDSDDFQFLAPGRNRWDLGVQMPMGNERLPQISDL